MRKIIQQIVAGSAAVLLLAACQKTEDASNSTTTENELVVTQNAAQGTTKYGSYDEEDFEESYDASTATKITLSKTSAEVDGAGVQTSDGLLTITQGGTYVLSGDFTGQIRVDAANETVRLVLAGVTMTNETSAVIYTEQADKTIITLAEGTVNTLTDGADYTFADATETEPDAVIFSKDDLTLNGVGKLQLVGNYSNGIRSKDDSDAAVTITDGNFTLTSGDDGIHATTDLVIDGGTIDVTDSYEGLEGATITINDGTISVVASDDGLNAAGGTSDETSGEGRFGADTFGGPEGAADSSKVIAINGGQTYIDAGGDGVDSNGNITMSDGLLIVNGPTDNGNAALDYEGEFTLTGGLLMASGSSGMAMGVSETSTQAAIGVFFDTTQAAQTLITLTDEDGTVLAAISPSKAFTYLVVSAPGLVNGQSVQVTTGGEMTGTPFNGAYETGTLTGGETLFTTTLTASQTNVDQAGNAASTQQMGGAPGGGGGMASL